MNHLHTAYNLGAQLAQVAFAKHADAALGDPAFWQGGEQTQQEQQQQPATAEEAAMSLPTGTFQGLVTKLSPEGERSTSVKVTPDALGVPDNLASIFQAEPTAKVEVAQPQAKAEGAAAAQQDLGIPSNLPGPQPPDPLSQEPKVAGQLDPSTWKKLTAMGKRLTNAEADKLTTDLLPWRSRGGRSTFESAVHSLHAGVANKPILSRTAQRT